jgi:hypothetical protein
LALIHFLTVPTPLFSLVFLACVLQAKVFKWSARAMAGLENTCFRTPSSLRDGKLMCTHGGTNRFLSLPNIDAAKLDLLCLVSTLYPVDKAKFGGMDMIRVKMTVRVLG